MLVVTVWLLLVTGKEINSIADLTKKMLERDKENIRKGGCCCLFVLLMK